MKEMKKSLYEQMATSLLPPTQTANKTPLCISQTNLKASELKTLGEIIAQHAPSCVIALGAISDNKAHIFIKVSADLVTKGIQANVLLKQYFLSLKAMVAEKLTLPREPDQK